MIAASIQLGYKDQAWFVLNPTVVLLAGQIVFLEQSDTYKIGDGSTQLSALSFLGGTVVPEESFICPCSDLTTPLTTGTTVFYFRAPYDLSLTEVRASLLTAQASGSIFTVNIKKNGTTILSTKLTIDNTETTSLTATPAVISDSAILSDDIITVDIDQIGNGTAIGLNVTLIGVKP